MPDHSIRDSRDAGVSLDGKRSPRVPRGTVVVRPDEDAALDALASDLLLHTMGCVRELGDVHVALAADVSCERFYMRLLYDPRFRDVPWKRTHLWVVQDAPGASSFDVIEESIVAQSDIPPEQVHRVCDPDPLAYEQAIQATLQWREKGHDRLDFVLLPMLDGAMSHGHADVGPSAGLVARRADARIAMTRRLIEASRFIGVLGIGAARAPAWRALDGRGATKDDALFLGDLRPVGGELRWYTDASACDDAPGLPPIPLEG